MEKFIISGETTPGMPEALGRERPCYIDVVAGTIILLVGFSTQDVADGFSQSLIIGRDDGADRRGHRYRHW